MGVAVGSGMDVHMDEPRTFPGVRKREPGLLLRLSKSRITGLFARVDVTTRLHPAPEAPVHVEDRPPRADHNGRARHVDRIGILVERALESIESSEDALTCHGLGLVDCRVGEHFGTYLGGIPSRQPRAAVLVRRHRCHA
jgi:hypothetical protein